MESVKKFVPTLEEAKVLRSMIRPFIKFSRFETELSKCFHEPKRYGDLSKSLDATLDELGCIVDAFTEQRNEAAKKLYQRWAISLLDQVNYLACHYDDELKQENGIDESKASLDLASIISNDNSNPTSTENLENCEQNSTITRASIKIGNGVMKIYKFDAKANLEQGSEYYGESFASKESESSIETSKKLGSDSVYNNDNQNRISTIEESLIQTDGAQSSADSNGPQSLDNRIAKLQNLPQTSEFWVCVIELVTEIATIDDVNHRDCTLARLAGLLPEHVQNQIHDLDEFDILNLIDIFRKAKFLSLLDCDEPEAEKKESHKKKIESNPYGRKRSNFSYQSKPNRDFNSRRNRGFYGYQSGKNGGLQYKSRVSNNSQGAKSNCVFHECQDHTSENCSLSITERLAVVKEKNLCSNCLRLLGNLKWCDCSGECSLCQQRHHLALHGAEASDYIIQRQTIHSRQQSIVDKDCTPLFTT